MACLVYNKAVKDTANYKLNIKGERSYSIKIRHLLYINNLLYEEIFKIIITIVITPFLLLYSWLRQPGRFQGFLTKGQS